MQDAVVSFPFFSRHLLLLLVPGFRRHRLTRRHVLIFAHGAQSFISLLEDEEFLGVFFTLPVVDLGVQILVFSKQIHGLVLATWSGWKLVFCQREEVGVASPSFIFADL